MTTSLAIIPKTDASLAFAKVDDFAHEEQAQLLVEDFTDAQNGMRRIIALGLNCFQLKEEKLKHGQFGPWLKEFAPGLSREHNGSIEPSTSLQTYMNLTKSALESIGFNIGEFLQIPSALGISRCGDFLMLPDEKLNKKQLHARTELFSVIDGKTQRQLLLQFKNEKSQDGGFRPPEKEVQAWLKEHHAELAGTKYADLPAQIQKAFKKQFRPSVPEALTLEGKRTRMRMAFREFVQCMDDKDYAALEPSEQDEIFTYAADLVKLGKEVQEKRKAKK